jgi:hypothetical protein
MLCAPNKFTVAGLEFEFLANQITFLLSNDVMLVHKKKVQAIVGPEDS